MINNTNTNNNYNLTLYISCQDWEGQEPDHARDLRREGRRWRGGQVQGLGREVIQVNGEQQIKDKLRLDTCIYGIIKFRQMLKN